MRMKKRRTPMNIFSGMSVAMVITKMSGQHDKHIVKVGLSSWKKKRNRRNFDQLSILAVIFILPFAITVIQSDQPKQTPFIGCAHILCVRLLLGQRKIMLCQLNFKLIEKICLVHMPQSSFHMHYSECFPYTQFIIHEHVECKKSQCNEFIWCSIK